MFDKEEQRYGRIKETAINHAYIDGGEYRKKFDLITDSQTLNKLLYQKAKEMLFHRSGTKFEDMYWIDAESEKVICQKLDAVEPETIRHTKAIANTLAAAESPIIAVHTHPQSFPPSAEDFNCFVECKYSLGIIICHDGTIFIYTAKRKINVELWSKYVEEAYRNGASDERVAQLVALNKFEANGDIEFWEVDL